MEITLDKQNNFQIIFKKAKETITTVKLNSNCTLEIDDFKIDSPGEYQIKEVFVERSLTNFFYLINIEKIKICYFPIKIKELKSEEVEQIGNINLLIINIDQFENKWLSELISQMEPQIIIPVYENKDQLNELLKLKGLKIENIDFLNKLSITLKNFTEEKTKIIALEKL